MRLPKVQYLIAAAVLAGLGYLAERIDWSFSLQSTAALLRHDLDKIDPIDGLWRMYQGAPETNCLPKVGWIGQPGFDASAEERKSQQRKQLCQEYCRNVGRCQGTESFSEPSDCLSCLIDCQTQPPESTMVPWCAGSPGSVLSMGQNFFSYLLPSLSWTGFIVWIGALVAACAAVTGLYMQSDRSSPGALLFWIIVGTPILAAGVVFILKWLLIGLVSILGATAGLIVWAFAAFKIASTLFGVYSTARDLESYAEGGK